MWSVVSDIDLPQFLQDGRTKNLKSRNRNGGSMQP